MIKNLPVNAGDPGDPGSGRSPRGGSGNPLQYSCLENPMDRGAWRAAVHGVERDRQDRACTYVASVALVSHAWGACWGACWGCSCQFRLNLALSGCGSQETTGPARWLLEPPCPSC